MFIFKNAMRNILRSKGRNILVGVIVLVIAVSSCLALSIRQAAANAKASGLNTLGITAQISMDRQSMMQKAQESGEDMMKSLQQMESLTLEEMQRYAASAYVQDFTYTLTSSMDAGEGLSAVDTTETEAETTDNSGEAVPGGEMPGGQERPAADGRAQMMGMGSQGDFTIVGYSGYEAMTAFVDGTTQITDGTVFDEDTSEPVCVISDELATLNSLQVGDTVGLVNPNNTAEVVNLTITGIYHNSNSAAAQTGMMRGFSAASDPANQIYTSYHTLKTIADASAAGATTETDAETGRTSTTAMREQVAGTYHFAEKNGLSAVENYEAFQTDATNLGLPEGYAVSSSDVEAYEQSLLPLENLSEFASWFLIVVLAVGGVVLIVLHIFNIRERKYEIGVLTAIGMRKQKVAAQFLAELFVITFAFLIIGTAVGAAVSVPVTNALLASQAASQENEQSSMAQNFGRPMGGETGGQQGGAAMMPGNTGGFGNMGSMVDYISQVSSATDWIVVLQLLAIGIVLTLLSACVAVAFVMRYEPLKILSERT